MFVVRKCNCRLLSRHPPCFQCFTNGRKSITTLFKTEQVKSEEYVRYHCDQEDQIDDFKRLKKLIHENGLPSIEQLIALQRQVKIDTNYLFQRRLAKANIS